MQTTTPHAQVTKTAIGYVRVSSQEQATEGVSLDAQRERIRSYCKLSNIRLIDIFADEGISGSTLDRPGLQAALRLIKRGRATTLIVAKLGQIGSFNPIAPRRVHAGGRLLHRRALSPAVGLRHDQHAHRRRARMLVMNLANFNEFERAMIAERTRDALQHLKAQGVRLGPAPHGYEYANQLDEQGRRRPCGCATVGTSWWENWCEARRRRSAKRQR